MKKILYLTLITLMILPINIYAYYDKVDDTDQKVYDYAEVLSKSEEEEFQEIAEDFLDKYKMDMVIVTVNKGYNSSEIEAYADDFYDYNGFGYGSSNDGIIIAIETYDMENDSYYIAVETTGKAIKNYTDTEIDKIFENLKKNKYDGVYDMILGFTKDAVKYRKPPINFLAYILLICLPFVIAGIILGILVAKNKMVRKATTAAAYLNKDNINILSKEDRFVTTHITRVPISTGSSGGSSTHRGSSGVSHGGGGRHV